MSRMNPVKFGGPINNGTQVWRWPNPVKHGDRSQQPFSRQDVEIVDIRHAIIHEINEGRREEEGRVRSTFRPILGIIVVACDAGVVDHAVDREDAARKGRSVIDSGLGPPVIGIN